jgi:hypothetical protein
LPECKGFYRERLRNLYTLCCPVPGASDTMFCPHGPDREGTMEGKKILVIDDDTEILSCWRNTSAKEGFPWRRERGPAGRERAPRACTPLWSGVICPRLERFESSGRSGKRRSPS